MMQNLEEGAIIIARNQEVQSQCTTEIWRGHPSDLPSTPRHISHWITLTKIDFFFHSPLN